MLIPRILERIGSCASVRVVVDLFSGTSRVGHALKGRGYVVVSNDSARFAHVIAKGLVQSDRSRWARQAGLVIDELNGLRGERGYFTETFCERSRFFKPENGMRIDAMRERIASMALDPELESVVLTALMIGADRVDSTTGVQMAYLKSWAPRAHKRIRLVVPDLVDGCDPGCCVALEGDAVDVVGGIDADLVYLDPPYNQHSYLGNYHVWETLCRWDKPEVYGVACKRVDCRERKSAFNSKRTARDAMSALIGRVRAPRMLVSFNDEGHISRREMEEILGSRGEVVTVGHDSARYVGARIGIHNPEGEKVGRVGRLRNTEYLFYVTPDPAEIGGAGVLGAA